MPPLVSVVVPAFGHADYILATLDSVFAQTHPALEVIVVNDGSPDDTEARLAPLVAAGRIRYVRQANGGQASARNHGASLARGAYLAFLDDDDLWPSDSVAWRVAELEATPDVAFVYGDYRRFSAAVPIQAPATGPDPRPVRVQWVNLFGGNPIISPGQALIRRSAFDACGGFDPAIWGADDWDLWFRLLKAGSALYVQRRALCYRVHAQNASRHAVRLGSAALAVIDRQLAGAPLEQRARLRYLAYTAIAPYWRGQVATSLEAARGRVGWTLRLRALRFLAALRARIVLSYVRLKAELVRAGRWRLATGDPMVQGVYGVRHSTEAEPA